MDRLSLLPNELLDDIFSLAHTETEPLTGPLSKCLLPFFQRSFYRDVLLNSYEQFDRLHQISRTRSDLLSLVCTLKLEIPTLEIEDEDGDSVETKDPNFPSNDAVVGLLSQLLHLQKLRIRGSSRIVLLLLTPRDENKFPFCSTLRVLQVRASFDSRQDPFEFLLLSTLHQYHALKALLLDFDRSEATNDLEIVDIAILSNYRQLSSSISWFSLAAPLENPRYAEAFVGSVPAPIEIRLLQTEISSMAVSELLSYVQQPHLVQSLKIIAPGALRPASDTFSPLRQFTHLKSIEADISASFDDILLILSEAPLESINLRWLCYIAIPTLNNLVTGSAKIETLREIVLDTVDAIRGRLVPRELAREELETWDLEDLDWVLPQWTDEFSREGFKDFLVLAKKEGIEVTGDAVEALKIEEEWEEEMEYYRSVVGT